MIDKNIYIYISYFFITWKLRQTVVPNRLGSDLVSNLHTLTAHLIIRLTSVR